MAANASAATTKLKVLAQPFETPRLLLRCIAQNLLELIFGALHLFFLGSSAA